MKWFEKREGYIKKCLWAGIFVIILTVLMEFVFNFHALFEGYDNIKIIENMEVSKENGINSYEYNFPNATYIKSIDIEGKFTKRGVYTLSVRNENSFGKEVTEEYIDEFYPSYTVASTNINQKVKSFKILIGDNEGATIKNITITNKFEWNKYRILLIAMFFLVFYVILFQPKIIENKLHIFYAMVSIFAGSLMILFAGPRYVTWDEEIHFSSVYEMASDSSINWTKAARLINEKKVPDYNTKIEMAQVRNYMNDQGNIWDSIEERDSTFIEYGKRAFFPMACLFQIGKWLKLPFTYTYMLAKFGNLLIVTLLIFWAIKVAEKKKIFIATLGLMPTVIFQSSNFTYDGIIYGCLTLGVILWINEIEKDDKLDYKSIIWMIILFVFGSFSKAVYIPIIILLLFLPKEKFYNSRNEKMFKMGIVIIFLLIMSTFVLPALVNTISGNLNYGGDTRGGDTSATRQMISMLSHPVASIKLIFSNIFSLENMSNTAAVLMDNNQLVTNLLLLNLGAFGCLHEKWSLLLIPILCLLFFVEDGEERKIKLKNRIQCIIVLGMIVGLIWVALYLGFTPVGSDYITGVQARYYLPILGLMGYICWNTTKQLKLKRISYYRIVLGGTMILLFQSMYQLCLIPKFL